MVAIVYKLPLFFLRQKKGSGQLEYAFTRSALSVIPNPLAQRSLNLFLSERLRLT
jgi:hypothetical protein